MKEVRLVVNPCNSVKQLALKIMAVSSHYITICQKQSALHQNDTATLQRLSKREPE